MKRIEEGYFTEWMAEESGFYGTPRSAFLKIPKGTTVLVWRGNIEGLEKIKSLQEDATGSISLLPFVGIFISPEKTLREYKLHVMANRTPEEALKRWNTVLWEMQHAPENSFGISYFIVNQFSDPNGIAHMVNDVLSIMDRSIKK
jgi:guanylate kinase